LIAVVRARFLHVVLLVFHDCACVRAYVCGQGRVTMKSEERRCAIH
jgi:hypothetical protein